MEKADYVIIFSSAGSVVEANKIADILIEKQLAACVSIIPGVTSHFRWKGEKSSSFEVIMMIKCLRSNFRDICTEIKAVHTYEVPEILMLPVLGGSDDYLEWVRSGSGMVGR